MIREPDDDPPMTFGETTVGIAVTREGSTRTAAKDPSEDGRQPKAADDDQRLLRELVDDLRDAFVPDRIAQALARHVERSVSDGIRDLIRERLARELREALRNAAVRGDKPRAESLLTTQLSDAIEDRARELLSDAAPGLLRDRLPNALRGAATESHFLRRYGPAALDDVADRMLAAAVNAIRLRLRDGLRQVLRARVAGLARERLDEAFRSAAASRIGGEGGPAEQVVATLGEVVEETLHERVVSGVMGRFRSIVANSLHEVIGERVATATAPADRADILGTPLREAMHSAIGHQLDVDVIEIDRLADAIVFELADVVCTRICEGVHERLADAVRTRLADAFRDGLE